MSDLGRAGRGVRIATGAAVIGSAADLGLLWVANAERPGFTWLPAPPGGILGAATVGGALAIASYAAGYRDVAAMVAPAGGRAAAWIWRLGGGGAAVGSVVHLLTGVILARRRRQGSAGVDPLAFVIDGGCGLLALWALASAIVLGGSIVYARTVAGGRTRLPRWMALVNPALLTIALGAAAAPSLTLRAFLLPAGPNVAHVIFFATAAATCRRDDLPHE